VLGHHVSDSSLKSYFANWASVVSHLLLLLNRTSTPSTALDVSFISDKVRIEVCKRTYIVGTRLDYCNAILAGTADTVIKRLQSVQKTAARLVSGTIFGTIITILRSPTGVWCGAVSFPGGQSCLYLYELCT